MHFLNGIRTSQAGIFKSCDSTAAVDLAALLKIRIIFFHRMIDYISLRLSVNKQTKARVINNLPVIIFIIYMSLVSIK